jgi:transcriptional regulator with XRE-family HTH domain
MQQADDGWQARPTIEAQTSDARTVIVDGPTLRSARLAKDVKLRQVARAARMSSGHLSKMERGEHGRPVTATVLRAYESALGIKIADLVASGDLTADEKRRADEARSRSGWRPGQLTTFQRQTWRAQVAAVAVGGTSGTSPAQMLTAAGGVNSAVDAGDPATMRELEQLVAAVESAGQLGGTVAHALMGWAIRLTAARPGGDRAGLETLVARLARVAATAAYRAGRHESARVLWLIGLHAATSADHADLRALILSDIAEQSATAGYPRDALAALRHGEGDERIGEDTRARLKQVRAAVDAAEEQP